MKTFSRHLLVIAFTFVLTSLFGQDIFYTVSGEIEDQKVSIDSILFENLQNGTQLLFDNLSDQPDYVINLSTQTLWGATGIGDLKFENRFSLLKNADGNLSIACNFTSPEPINISIYNVQGQSLYVSSPMHITAGNSINVQLAKMGVYFVKVESVLGSKTFKALGSDNYNSFDVELNYQKYSKNTNQKNSLNTYDSEFSFVIGDSLRVSVYKDGFYTLPKAQPILASAPVNFVFETSTVNETGITDTYVNISDEGQDSLSFNVISGDIIVTGETTIVAGNVIVLDADTSGFLRKIVNVVDDNGTTVLETEQALLNDIFVEADFKLNTELIEPTTTLKSTSTNQEIANALTDEKGYIHPVKVIYYDKTGVISTKSALDYKSTSDESINLMDYYNDFSGTDLYGSEGDNVRLYVDEGHTSFVADAVFEFDFNDEGRIDETTKVKIGDIETFKFYLDANAGFKSVLALDMNASYSKEDIKKLLNFTKATAKFIVPPGVPVWITFDCDVYGSYAFNADASLHADWGFESNHSLQAGGLYERSTNAFTPIYDYTPDNTIFPLNIEGEVNASARFEIFPRVDIKLYSVLGPYAEIVPFIDAGYNAAFQSQITNTGTESFLAWNSNLDLGLDFRLGVDLRILGYNKDFGPTIINAFNTPLWRSPETIELSTELPTEADEGTLLNLSFKVTDLLNLPVPLCPVYIEGDGSFNKQIAISDINGEVDIDWTIGEAGENEFTAFIYNADKIIIQQLSFTVTAVSTGGGETGTFTDARDGQSYTTIEIGNQVWMGENLKYLPAVVGPTTESYTIPYYYVYDYNGTVVADAKATANYATYGVLYNWPAACTSCPSGWHLPSDSEWTELTDYLINNGYGYDGSGDDIGKSIATTSGWTVSSVIGDVGNDGATNNSIGFSALPPGYRTIDGSFQYIGDYSTWWSTTESSSTYAWYCGLYHDKNYLRSSIYEKEDGFSVRCVKDSENSGGNLILSEDFEDNQLHSFISINKIGSYLDAPGIKSRTNFGSLFCYGFGKSTCGASCFERYATEMIIDFPQATYVESFSFKVMELDGNWGSKGKVYVDGVEVENVELSNLPSNDGTPDLVPRIIIVNLNSTVSQIKIRDWDITSSSEIFIDDLLIYGN